MAASRGTTRGGRLGRRDDARRRRRGFGCWRDDDDASRKTTMMTPRGAARGAMHFVACDFKPWLSSLARSVTSPQARPAMTLEAKTPASAWRASPGSDAPPSAPPSAAAVDDGRVARAETAPASPPERRHHPGAVGPLDASRRRPLATTRRATRVRPRPPVPVPDLAPFSAARGSLRAPAGNGATRCHVCGGEHERNRMVALPGCSHAFCAPCMEAWATRRARNCPLCKAPFEGWYHGERDESTGRWTRAFRALPDADAEPRRGATRAADASKSARALARRRGRGGTPRRGQPDAGASAGAGGAGAARGGRWKDAAAEEWRSSDEEAEEEEEGRTRRGRRGAARGTLPHAARKREAGTGGAGTNRRREPHPERRVDAVGAGVRVRVRARARVLARAPTRTRARPFEDGLRIKNTRTGC